MVKVLVNFEELVFEIGWKKLGTIVLFLHSLYFELKAISRTKNSKDTVLERISCNPRSGDSGSARGGGRA